MINNPIQHKNFFIQLQGDGFRPVATSGTQIASYWVVCGNPKIRSIFAFSTSLFDLFENPHENQERLLESAVSIIKQYIDESKVEDLGEYTFRYKSRQFVFDESPRWWNKSLKVLLGSKTG